MSRTPLVLVLAFGVGGGLIAPSVARAQAPTVVPPNSSTDDNSRWAEQDNAEAHYSRGIVYKHGIGVTKDAAEAVKSLRTAAELGHTEARLTLGLMYVNGDGVSKDAGEAMKWYRLAAEQGSARAQSYVGYMYETGLGVTKDVAEAQTWYRTAAAKGDALAQVLLGAMYATGNGVPRDSAEAVKWYRLAAEQGNAKAQCCLGFHYATGEGVAKDVAEAAKWYRLAAAQGDADAQCGLGGMYWFGAGVPKDLVRAYAWATLAATGGSAKAKELRSLLSKEMTREQVGEALGIAADFEPEVSRASQIPGARPPMSHVPSSCCGFFVTTDGYFVTSHHAVADAARIRVQTSSGTLAAQLVRSDPTSDIAILQVQGEFAALPVRGSRDLRLASPVSTIDYPSPDRRGEAPKCSTGAITALSGGSDDHRFLQISMPIRPSNSGGPLVDATGSVVGVVVGRINGAALLNVTDGIPAPANYAIKGTVLLTVLESVPGLVEKILSEPARPNDDPTEIAKAVEAACGLVFVEK